jgi:3-oxoacyl-[acyl-carrier protein] reductase
MDLGLKGKKAIICASSRGLGKACAISLARAGVDLVINGQNQDVLNATAEELRRYGIQVSAVIADISSKKGQAEVLSACPAPDILINNNGGPPYRNFREISREAMLDGVTMNMVTPIEMIQAVIDGMCERGFGRIVNITSLSVKMPVFGLDLSSGARAGLTAFLAGVARSVADKNVTINCLLPGFFDTDRLRSGIKTNAASLGKSEEDFAAERAAQVPAKRFGNPAEFGDACAFLCSAQAGYITGQSLLLDGGVYNSAF